MGRASRWFASVGFALAACSPGPGSNDGGHDGGGGPDACFFGDPSLPVEIEPVFLAVDGGMLPITANAEVPLFLPPQGGKILAVGVRARNLDVCAVTVASSLRDPCSSIVVALDQRPVQFAAPDGGGWVEPLYVSEILNYANVPACPSANLERDVNGLPHLLTVRVEDSLGRKADRSVRIVPTCADSANRLRCECECAKDYVLGSQCVARDAGAADAGALSCDGG